MDVIRKPIWSEGLFMTPEVLQQLDEYHERLLRIRLASVAPHAFGIDSCSFDQNALSEGKLRIVHATGIFPDGTPFLIDGCEGASVEPRDIVPSFPSERSAMDVYLVLARPTASGENVAPSHEKATSAHRFIAQETHVRDFNAGQSEASLTWARPYVRVVFDSESRQGVTELRIGRLVRDSQGRIALDPKFIPTVLHVSASANLGSRLDQLLGVLHARKRYEENDRRASRATQRLLELPAAKLLLRQLLQRAIFSLSHLTGRRHAHPEDLYLVLGEILRDLSALDDREMEIVTKPYLHTELAEVLIPMFEEAEELIQRCLTLTYDCTILERRYDGLHLGQVIVSPQSSYLLHIVGPGVSEAGDDFFNLLKVASWNQIGSLLQAAVHGVRVRRQTEVPSGLPRFANDAYLNLDQQGEYWSDIAHSGTIAVYHPLGAERLELRVVAVPTGSPGFGSARS